MPTCQSIALAGLAVCLSNASALAQTCPPPPSSINPSVSSKVSYDPNTKTYTYRYTVRNAKDSMLPIDYFVLSLKEQPSSIQSPDNWLPRYIDLTTAPPNLRWATIVTASSNSSEIGGPDLPVPTHAIRPGRDLDGFSFESAQPPGIVQYYAEGFTQIPSSTPNLEDDEPEPNCPGWDFKSPRLQTLVTGMSVGPASANVISVRIRLREQDREHASKQMDPDDSDTLILVLVLSSGSFDASKIDVSSIRFGRGEAVPISSNLVTDESRNVAQSDQHEDWETFDDNSDQNSRFPDLLLLFDRKSLAVQCTLDKALFLTGNTQSGARILGGASTRRVGCAVQNDRRDR